MKKKAQNSKRGAQSGQSLVEVALMTPVLVAMLLGAIELGRYAYLGILVGNAAHAGAMYGSQSLTKSTDQPGIILAADNDFQNNGQSVSSLAVSSSDTCGCDSQGAFLPQSCGSQPACGPSSHWAEMVSVTATATFRSLFKYPWIPRTITVSRTSTMRLAQF